MADNQKPIFLSHSYHDKDLADRLIKLLTNGCDVSPNDILCTSLPGKDIKVGEPDFIKYLKDQLANPTLVILLITENYLASSFCLAELGAVWRMGFDCFPLAVKPIEQSEIGGVLAVVQAGDISQENYLDQLQVKIKDVFGKAVPTPAWTVEKDVFLNGLDALIKKMKKPDVVKRAELEKVQDQYTYALESIKKKDSEIGKLKEHIVELEKHRPAAVVKAVAKRFSKTDEQFDELQEKAQETLNRLERATRIALFWEMSGDSYCPSGQDEWEEVETAKAEKELDINEGQVGLNFDHPRVMKAKHALDDLKDFLSDDKQSKFVGDLTDEHEFPITLSNKEFWRNFLVHV